MGELAYVNASRGSTPDPASKSKIPASALSDDGDIVMDVKGKGKEILRHDDVPNRRNGQRSLAASKVVSLDDDDDDDVKVAFSPQPPRSGSYGGRRTRSQRLASTVHEDESPSNPLEDSQSAVKKPPDDDDDESDDDLQIVDGPPEADDEPDEFEEYVRRARERAEERERQAKLKLERESQAKDSQEIKTPGQGSPGVGDDSDMDSRESAMDNVVVKILVTSEIPRSRPKLFERRFHAPLGLVRDTWASEQKPPVAREMWPRIFLTWKGNRIYGTTTCANLGIRVQSVEDRIGNKWKLGNLAGAGYAHSNHGSGLHDGGLHLEAWTEELYQDYLKRRERERLRLLGQLDDEDDDDGAPGTGARGSEDPDGGGRGGEEATTRVILKAAKDYEPLRFKVHAHTTIDEMITTFRMSRKVPEDKDVSIFFDGERLDGDMAVKDTEIEDMDSLEVHVK